MIKPLLQFVSGLLLAYEASAQDTVLLSYQSLGVRGTYSETRVEILTTGGTVVSLQKHGSPVYSYRTTLSPHEVEAFHVAIRSTAFFTLDDQPSENTPRREHTGKTTLTINLGGQNRTLLYGHRPELAPLELLLRKLQAQASTVEALTTDGDIYSTLGSVSKNMAGTAALQPQALKKPFMDYILTHQDQQKLRWVLSGLAHVTTPEEYLGFLSSCLEIPSQRDLLLSVMGGGIPQTHLEALYPLYFSLVQDGLDKQEELTQAEADRLENFISTLVGGRYPQILPILVERLNQHDLTYTPTPLYPLAKMGEVGLVAILPYLENSNTNRRLSAIELIRVVSRKGPNGGFANPLPKHEFDRIISIFHDTVIPRMQKMAEEDPSEDVRKSAKEAMEEIRSQLKKEEISTNR